MVLVGNICMVHTKLPAAVTSPDQYSNKSWRNRCEEFGYTHVSSLNTKFRLCVVSTGSQWRSLAQGRIWAQIELTH